MDIIVKWILTFAAAEAGLNALRFLLRKREIKPAARAVLIIVKIILALAFAVLPLAGPVQLRFVQPLMFALYAALLTDSFADIIYSVFCAAKKCDRKFGAAAALSLIFGVLFFVYGTVNMQTVQPNYLTYTSGKLHTSHKIIFVSDIHVGSAQSFAVLKEETAAMKAEQPEAIILGGDITDDYTTKSEMQDVFRLFGETGIPVYYIYGNHDRQKHAQYANGKQYSDEELTQAIESSGIVILKDDFVQLGDDLLLLGREDLSEEGRIVPCNPSSDKYLIVADHQPFEFMENIGIGCDLQLSGHTHAGQLFPLKWLYALIGYSYGGFEEAGSKMFVSSGASGWRVPFRTDAHCNFEVIELKPETPAEAENSPTSEKTAAVWSSDKVTFTVEPDSVSSKGCTAVIEDKNDEPAVWGSEFAVQISAGGERFEDLITTPHNSALRTVFHPDENGVTEMGIDWSEIYGELNKGTYRLVKYYGTSTVFSEPFDID